MTTTRPDPAPRQLDDSARQRAHDIAGAAPALTSTQRNTLAVLLRTSTAKAPPRKVA